MERENEALIENDSPNDQAVTSIKEMLEGLVPLSPTCCIYNVPEKLSKLNGEAYKPRAVSIGPLHRGQQSLQIMENHKLRYLQSFLFRTSISLEDYVKLVRTWEVKARDCYAKAIDLSGDEFVKMLAVDGGFVVELLLKSYFCQFIDTRDHIFYSPRMIDDVARDMILLENQVPLFVLEGLLSLMYYSNQEENPSILDLTHEHFKKLLNISKFPYPLQRTGIEHFLDFLRFCYLPSSPGEWRKSSSTIQFSPTATRLHDAGIKFKVGESSCLLDIKFTEGFLEMPHFEIDDLTETLFRNLIAFEQCHYTDRYIIQYMALISSMIKTPKDAELLIHHGIITSRLGSDEDLSALFNNICKEVIFGHNLYFFDLCENLNAYCRTPWNKWKATFKRDYFNSPWAIVSLIAAVILLVLTFIQTLCSIISLKL